MFRCRGDVRLRGLPGSCRVSGLPFCFRGARRMVFGEVFLACAKVLLKVGSCGRMLGVGGYWVRGYESLVGFQIFVD